MDQLVLSETATTHYHLYSGFAGGMSCHPTRVKVALPLFNGFK